MDSKTKADLRLAAFNMLARREHSRKELFDKLKGRSEETALIEQVLDELRDEGLQSDKGFTESFIHSRIQRHQGPLKISYELRKKGISDTLLEEAMQGYRDQWHELADDLVRKKYGAEPPENLKEKQRRMRFVMQRGFPAEICYKLFD